jgi:diaminopimelate decarboxylase
MGFNYNAKLRAGELLLRSDNKIIEIRRKEQIDDYFATLDFKKLAGFKA